MAGADGAGHSLAEGSILGGLEVGFRRRRSYSTYKAVNKQAKPLATSRASFRQKVPFWSFEPARGWSICHGTAAVLSRNGRRLLYSHRGQKGERVSIEHHLNVEWWPIDMPAPYAKNPRKPGELGLAQGRVERGSVAR